MEKVFLVVKLSIVSRDHRKFAVYYEHNQFFRYMFDLKQLLLLQDS
jgi:hypothetical protein